MIIRPAKNEDFEQLIWEKGLVAFQEGIKKSLEKSLEGRNLYLVADNNGEILGQIQADLPKEHVSSYISALRVREEYRNKGIGTQLIVCLENNLKQRGYKKVRIAVNRENSRALKLYERLGYKITGKKIDRWPNTHNGKITIIEEEVFELEKDLVIPHTIYLNNTKFHLSTSDLPCLIIGNHGAGSSFFTVELMIDLFLQGEKILLFSAYPMAKEQFIKETEEKNSEVAKVLTSEDLEKNKDKQAILLMENNPALFVEAVKTLPDISTRIIMIKNLEEVDSQVFEAALPFNNLIISGDIDACNNTGIILEKRFSTHIFFSKSLSFPMLQLPDLNKYQGYMLSKTDSGIMECSR